MTIRKTTRSRFPRTGPHTTRSQLARRPGAKSRGGTIRPSPQSIVPLPQRDPETSASKAETAITRKQFKQMVQQALAVYDITLHPSLKRAPSPSCLILQKAEIERRLLHVRNSLRNYGCGGDDA